MEPRFADGWFALGWAQEKNEDSEGALVSYSRAVAAKPDHSGALFSRAYLRLFTDDLPAAIRDFSATLALTKGEFRLYTHLWMYIARSKADKNAAGNLARDSQDDNLSFWPGALVRYYLGTMNEAQVLRAIESGPANTLQERRCAGYFFLGEHAALRGDSDTARKYFEKTLATGVIKLRQFDAARRELAKL